MEAGSTTKLWRKRRMRMLGRRIGGPGHTSLAREEHAYCARRLIIIKATLNL
jgi:hypothetical protein